MTSTDHVLSAYLGIMPRTSEAAVLRLLVELGVQYVGAEEGSLLVLDRAKGQLVFAMTTGQSEKTLTGQHVPLGKGLTGLAAATREVQIGAPTFKDVKQRQRLIPSSAKNRNGGSANSDADQPTAVIAAPMLIRDGLVGVITAVSFASAKRFTSTDAALYAKIASVAAVVVDQHRQLQDVDNLRQGLLSPSPQPEAGKPGGGLKPPASEADRLGADIVACVGRLVRERPARLPEIHSLLGAVETLCGFGAELSRGGRSPT